MLHDAKAAGHWVEVPEAIASTRHSRDPDDDKFIHVAVAAGAPRLLTGDADLRVLDGTDGVRILTPALALAESRPSD